ncbi:MAG: GNAT family N-acetyltransferase [Elusimicrobia bacterium]|nr:GNAT family N-acetyltransferase [Elusimicrobiota bacterium]MDE2424442.1 GNAT family N-acetyltransferase [Elusimicrobiota bacterium]
MVATESVRQRTVPAVRGSAPIAIEQIDGASPYLQEVMRLWRARSSTLGLFPEGAFKEYAARRNILVATEKGACIGYLLFRHSRDLVVIVHLCVGKGQEGKGIAKALVARLHADTQRFRGIGLSCRRDYDASKVWPKLGFTAVHDKPGRGKDGAILTYWWLDHNHPTLFSNADKQRLDSKLIAAIDHNVFLDLYKKRNADSEALEADWLQDSLQLCVTNEILNEINQMDDGLERGRQRDFYSRFQQLTSDQTGFQSAYDALARLFDGLTGSSDDADRRHLARSIASGATVFVTRDTGLLEKAADVYDSFGLLVIHPSDLIARIDELQRASVYQPARLAGTLFRIGLLAKDQLGSAIEAFHNGAARETKATFQASLRSCLSHPKATECSVVTDSGNHLQAVFALDRSAPGELRVPVLRVGRDLIGSTLSQHIVMRVMFEAAKEGRRVVRVTDPFLPGNVVAALQKDQFVKTSAGWSRLCLNAKKTQDELRKTLAALAKEGHGLSLDALNEALDSTESGRLLDLERALWPAKIVDADVPTFLVPIKPTWAQHLFDHELASEDLFGGELTLNREAVYYRAARPSCGLSAPGRILWYVSQDGQSAKTGQVRACSFLDEVVVDKPKVLFKRFQRLGIYKWPDLYALVKKDINRPIMALRFSDTVALEKPVSFAALKQVAKSCDVVTTLQSPLKISPEFFKRLIA